MRHFLTVLAVLGVVAAQAREPGGVRIPSRALGATHDCASFYPEMSQVLGEQGDVTVQYDVDANGSVGNVSLKQTSGSDRLDQAALDCVRQAWRNEPAMVDGKPVASPRHVAIVRFMPGPQTALDHLSRGRWFVDHGRYAAAIADFEIALQMDPTLKDAIMARADALSAEAQNRPARIPWVPEPRPPSPASANEEEGQTRGATSSVNSCASYYPDLSRRLNESGDVTIKYDVDAGGGVINVRVFKSSGYDRLDRAAVACVARSPSRANGSAQEHLAIIRFTLQPGTSEYLAAGLKAEAAGDYDQAIVSFTSAIAADPGNADAYHARGTVYDKLGKHDLADADNTKARSLGLR